MNKLLIISVLLLLSACATPPSQEVLSKADYGEFPDNYEGIIKNYLSVILKDPDSAKYTFLNEPKKGWSKNKYGYVICVNINAKNGFGGYVGMKLNGFMIRDARVVIHNNSNSDWQRAITEGFCSHFI